MGRVIFSVGIQFAAGEITNRENPIIGYDNLVTVDNLSTTTADPDFPAINLANPSTALKWKGAPTGSPTSEYIRVGLTGSDSVNYLAVQGHNWGSAGIAVTIGWYTDSSPGTFNQLVQTFTPTDDGPILVRFTRSAYSEIVINLAGGTADPEAAVLYVGDVLVMERRIYAGHGPLPHNRVTNVVTNRSESGNYLGRIITNQTSKTKALFSLIDPAFYRSYVQPFVEVAQETPFFFAWRPLSYPSEIGFVWLTTDPHPVNEAPSALVAFELEMQGVVE